jgi:uncharacterized OB-fold protein
MTVGPVVRNEATAAFFDGTARGEFLFRRCTKCGAAAHPMAEQCPQCGATALDWEAAGGGASLVSWTVFHDPSDGDAPPTTTVLAIAELDEGPWWWSLLVDVEPAEIHAGQRLRLDFQRNGNHEAVPVFRPE